METAKEFLKADNGWNDKDPVWIRQEKAAELMESYTNIKLSRLKLLPEGYDGKANFEQVALPVIKYLAENHHPHTTAIFTSNRAEILEGIKSIVNDDYIPD